MSFAPSARASCFSTHARSCVADGPDLILLAIEDLTEYQLLQDALEAESLKKIEEQVRQRKAQLAHALRISTVSALASGLAHEINQPLSTIANDRGVRALRPVGRSGRETTVDAPRRRIFRSAACGRDR